MIILKKVPVTDLQHLEQLKKTLQVVQKYSLLYNKTSIVEYNFQSFVTLEIPLGIDGDELISYIDAFFMELYSFYGGYFTIASLDFLEGDRAVVHALFTFDGSNLHLIQDKIFFKNQIRYNLFYFNIKESDYTFDLFLECVLGSRLSSFDYTYFLWLFKLSENINVLVVKLLFFSGIEIEANEYKDNKGTVVLDDCKDLKEKKIRTIKLLK